MPRSELGPHQALLEVPAGLDARREVFCCRYTGEVFLEYEEYVKRQNLYRQRAWSSKYSGEGGMTYEEAVASEHKVASVVEQFPAVYEERALRLVHHSTEPLEQLATRVLAHFTNNFVVGEELTGVLPDGRLAPCVVRSVHSTSAPAPQPLPNGILAGCEPNGPTEGPDGPSVGGAAAAAAEGNAGFGGGEQPLQQQQGQQGQPQASSHEEASYEVEWTGVESSPAAGQHSTVQRGALNRRHPSPITALTPALLSKWLETVAWAEPVTGVPGVDCVWHVCDFYRDKYSLPEQLPADMAERLRPSRQKALLKVPSLKDGAAGRRGGEVEFVESTFSEDDEQGAGGLGPGAGDGKPFVDRGEKGDHDFQVEEELQVAREEYASDEEFESDDDYRPIHPGLEGRMKPPPARTPRGRGRGRWGRGRGRWGAGPRLAHSPPEPPPPASQQPPPPPSLQASDVQAMVESLEEVERRLQPGSIKHSVFMILKEAGEAGVTISDLVTAAEEKGLKTWDDPRQAKNSVASTCAHDPAFVRVGPAKFALRALVSSQQLLAEDSVPLDQLDEGAQKQLATVGQQQKEAMRKLAEEKHKPKVEKNNFKCPKCHRTTHHEQSPLLLCDTCPRSYHMACLGLDWRDLPSDDWCCPKCVESTQAALRRVMDLETRKREALERATSRQSEAEDKLLRRLLQKEERERRKAEGLPLGTAGSRALRPAQRGPPDDWETLQDEKENLGRLEIRARELAELAARNPLPEGGIDFADDETASVHQRAAETREALHRLQQILAGPPTFEPLVGSAACAASLAAAADGGGSTGAGLKVEAAGGDGDGDRGDSSEVQQAVLNEALSLAEFLRIFGEACVAPILTVQDLYRAAAWPLDSPSLPALYSAMLQCCLLEQLNHDPPAKNRARRWSRMLTLSDSVWPELLRRYLAVTRSKTAKDTSYDLTVDPVLMSDDQVALFAAEHLSEAPWWTLPASAHLRLLNVLCYDVAQGYRLRQEINARQQDIVKIQTERFREQTQGRRGGSVVVGGKRGADNGELAPTTGSKKRKGKKAAAAIALPEPTEEELEEMEAELEAAALEEGEGELDEAARARRQREAEYDARMQLRASRTEPLGLDRYHRRYWWLRSDPGFVFVEGADGGGGMAAIRTKEELDEVISKLNRRGPREGGLHRGLRRRYNAITTAMANQLSQDAVAGCYVLAQVPRPAAPPPAVDGAPAGATQHSVEELARAQDAEVLSEAREKLELFITETQDIGVQMSCELKEVRRQLRAAQTPQQLTEFLLVLESFLGTAGEGLPPGADNVSIALLLGDVPALPEAPSSTALEMQDTAQGGQPGPTAGSAPAAGPAGQTPVKQEPLDGGAAPGSGIDAAAGGPAAGEAGVAGAEQRGAAGQEQEQQEGAVKMEVDEGLGAQGSAADLAAAAAAAGDASVSLAAAAADVKQEDGAAGAAVDVAMADALQADQQPAGEAAAPQASAQHATAAAAAPALLGKPPLPPSAFAAAGDASGAVPAADEDGAQQGQQALAQHAQQRPLVKSDSLAESLGGATTATGDEQTQGTGADAGQEQFRPVQPDDDLEDSDAEHAYLREKRMRRPARLWRSARERAVWIKLTREAGNIATKACYAALLLRDRAGPMLQRFISIADEQARWEAEERERQRLEKAESRKRLSETGEEGPPERPLMIRTGKAKTEEGVKIVLKAMGNQPFAMGRHASSIDIIAAPEQVAACRWGYQCSVCLLAGDLLCCEHPDGCNVSCHTECTGLAGLPKGPYICMNHDSRELKTRIRRRASSSLPAKEEAPGGEGAADDDEATVSEDTQTVDSEATEDEAPRSRSARKRPRRG